ncbi:hypothetical protein N7517_008368 [Penicillium concentricum]|uniref:Uncharacterized protein n=1 Tax=Penicillium concentricum TaxID=293559 RepID=A0A9W9RS91_9EURO|nr:uncharacterized protein N7517_008368 [Penicillium concentricum]KAJ5365482.1 hypothetical protein N7517_008368 [Penicillium concentricum]
MINCTRRRNTLKERTSWTGTNSYSSTPSWVRSGRASKNVRLNNSLPKEAAALPDDDLNTPSPFRSSECPSDEKRWALCFETWSLTARAVTEAFYGTIHPRIIVERHRSSN